ncbi:MAG: PA14 domain-containing protein [Chloroflexales bacterium]
MNNSTLNRWWLWLGMIAMLLAGLMRPAPPTAAQMPLQSGEGLILSGELNLPTSVYVFAQSMTAYGIYYLEGDTWRLVTSVPVSAVTVDRVTAKLSPDLQRVAYMIADGETGNSAVFTTDRFGMGTNLIYSSEDPALAATSFAWYGEQVAYTLARGPFAGTASEGTANNLAEQAAVAPYAGEIWLSSIDGITQTQTISQSAGLVLGSTDGAGPLFYTAVNTQTQELVGLNSVSSMGEVTELFRSQVNAEGHGTVYLSFDLAQTAPGVTRIAAVTASEFGATVPESGTQLITTALDGGDVQTVLSDPMDIGAAVWSPQGDKVAVVRQSTGEASIYNLGQGTTQTIPGAIQTSIQWSTNGESLITLPAINSDTNPFSKGLMVLGLNGATLASAETQANANTNFARYLVPGFNPTTFEPYVHQKLDTPASFGGKYNSCGSSSTVTVLASLGKISGPLGGRVQDFHNGHTYNGIYVPSASFGREPSERALRAYGIDQNTQFHISSLQGVINALERNHAVIASTLLTPPPGHIITIIGYDRAGADVRLIVNDSWGNANNPIDPNTNKPIPYGTARNGQGVVYTWEKLKFQWGFEVNAAASASVGANQWRGEYYNNPSLAGAPALVRGDDAINFIWGGGSAAPSLPVDSFSVRWKRDVTFTTSGVYRFTTTSDDGLRILIDGRPVLNQWYPHPPTAVNTDVYIAAGRRSIMVEYYEAGGGATAQVGWGYLSPGMAWEGSYYSNRNLQGEPAFIRNDGDINFNWGYGSPGGGVGVDDFSVRWQRSLYLPGGAWQFYTRSDDGSRAFLDGRQVLNQWWDHPAESAYSVYQKIDAGNHNLAVDFYERGGAASMQFAFWPRVIAEYWDQRDFRGNYRTEVLNSVDRNWGLSGPHRNWWQSQDNFSTRYTWPVSLRGGDYRICVDSDDGFRFIVDNITRFERWKDSNSTTCQNIRIDPGWRTFRVEHYENGGGARVRVTWGRADGSAWYGIAQPSMSALTNTNVARANAQPATVDDLTAYFQLLHEHGTLGLGLEAEQQVLPSTYLVHLPLIVR